MQIVAFACYCPRYIQLYQLSDLIQIKTFGLDTLDGVYKDFGFTDTEYSGDSLFIKMNPTVDFNGEIELESYIHSNNLYASQPCDPESYKRSDSILDITITSLDTFGAYLPNQSILGIRGWSQRDKDRYINSYHNNTWDSEPNDSSDLFAVWLNKNEHSGKVHLKIQIELYGGRMVKAISNKIYWY